MARLDKVIQSLRRDFDEVVFDEHTIFVKPKKSPTPLTEDECVRKIKQSFPHFLIVDQSTQGKYCVVEFFV